MPDSPIINGIRPSTEEVTDVNGATVTAQHVQRMLLAISPTDGDAVDLPGDATYGLGVDVKRLPAGVFAYAAGTAAGTVDVPAGGRVKRVSVIADSAGTATVAIAGGATITIPAGGSFDEEIPGDVAAGADVVFGGAVSSYYVAWTV